MNKTKFRWITLISLAAALFLILGCVFALPVRKAGAVGYTPATIFAAGTNGEVGASDADEDDVSYIQLTLRDGGKAHFRRHLALKWFEKAPETEEDAQEENGPVNPGAVRYLTFAMSVPEVNFTELEISFESAEENISKDAKATNSIVIFGGETAQIAIKNAGEQDTENKELGGRKDVDLSKDLEFALTEDDECKIGEFKVLLNGSEIGKFTNIGGNYLEYRSSSATTPNTPITFTATLEEGKENQKILMKELNGQTFEVADGKVEDTAPAVLVLDEEVYAFTLGKRFSLTYQAIDVCDDSVTVTRSYYMAKKGEDNLYKKPNEETDDDYKTLTTSVYFMPTTDTKDEEREYVSIRFKLDDGTDENDTYVYLTWYAAKGSEEHPVVTTLGSGEEAFDYILVDREKEGPRYAGIAPVPYGEEAEGDENVRGADARQAIADYQSTLDEMEKDLSAGSGAYIYLPSMRALFTSDYGDYRNLKFSIYYYKESASAGSAASSQTSLSYNALKFEINEMGTYKFRVLATDGAGNNIRLRLEGEEVDVTGSNIWEIDGIPEFTFNVGYDGARIEDAGEQNDGYRDSTYTFSNFDIIALSGYETEYKLYHLDSSRLPEGKNEPTYSDLVENIKDYMSDEEFFKALDEIQPYNSDVEEDDAAWDKTDNDYAWRPDSSLSFMPKVTGLYILQVTVSDANLQDFVQTSYQAIQVRNPIDTIPGQSQWLQENVISVVFFCIAGVLAIAIVVLFLVKPADKKVDEIDLQKLKGKKKNKN